MSPLDSILNNFFNWELIWGIFPTLLTTGLSNTLILSLSATVIGLLLGLGLALMGVSRIPILRVPARIYTDIFRGLPTILTILLIGQGLAPITVLLFDRNPYPMGVFALSLISSAYIGEIFRSGIQSVDKGQMEACRALGMSHSKAMMIIIVPQGIRRVLPALMNQFIAIVKDSSLIYFLGLLASQRELFRVGQDEAVTTGNLSPLVAAGLVYLIITVPLTYLVNWWDKRLREGPKSRPATSTSVDPTPRNTPDVAAPTGDTPKVGTRS